MIALRPAVVIAAVLLVAACSGGAVGDRAEVGDTSADAPVAASSSEDVGRASGDRTTERGGAAATAVGGPSFVMGDDGGATMHTRNGAMAMSLRGDSIVIAFSDSIRQGVRRELAESMQQDSSDESALGQVIQGVVKSSVSGALREVFEKSRGFPLSALRGIDYDQGALRFDFVRRPTWDMEQINTDDTPLLQQFHPADAARFVGAVRARLAH